MSSRGSRSLACWLAFGVPFVVYAFTSSAHSYWLDSGEFVAASVRLDIAHPPGHPISQLYGKLCSLVPLGSLAWRVALGQALAGALAALFACIAIQRTIARLEIDEGVAWSLAVAGAWLPALAYGMWFQAVRPEVYALQTLCMSFAMERCTRLDAGDDSPIDTRALYAVALGLGLGLANHHLIALLVAPAFLPATLRVLRARGVRPLAYASGFGLLALGAYAYLPVRALVPPPINLGNPSTWENFMWVLSARVYTKNLAFLTAGSPTERAIDMLVLLLQNVHYVVLLMAVVGAYLALRHPATRRSSLMFVLVFVIDVGFRAWMGSVLGNPDILGYLGPAFIALGALAALAVALLWWLIQDRFPRARRLGLALAVVAPLCSLSQARAAWSRASLADFAATDTFDDRRMRMLPPRAVLVAGTAQTTFRYVELDTVEVVRPDVTLVPLSFLGYPGTASLLMLRAPHVAALVEMAKLRSHFPGGVALAQTETHPVFAEIEARTPARLFSQFEPSHLMHRMRRETEGSVAAADMAQALRGTYGALYSALGKDITESETAKQLLWMHFLDALFFASLGERAHAREALGRAQALNPHDVDVKALGEVLHDPTRSGPVDITPFLHHDLMGR